MNQENAPPVPVVNASLLLSVFGYWPTFHDGEVHRALLDRGGSGESPSVTLVLHAFDTDNTVDEKGYYRVTTSVLATLRFDDVRESELRDLGSQNVLSSLEFELDASGRVRVTLGPCYGLSGSLLCGEVTVISVVPWPSPTEGAPPVRKDPVS
jgi:Immunity protein 50